MAFSCEDCHKRYDCNWDGHLFQSYGPCEDCGKTSVCVDCHAQPKRTRKGETK